MMGHYCMVSSAEKFLVFETISEPSLVCKYTYRITARTDTCSLLLCFSLLSKKPHNLTTVITKSILK